MSAADNWRALPADERRDLVAFLIEEGVERTLAARRAHAELARLRAPLDRANRAREIERTESLAADRAKVLQFARGLDPEYRYKGAPDPWCSFIVPRRWWT